MHQSICCDSPRSDESFDQEHPARATPALVEVVRRARSITPDSEHESQEGESVGTSGLSSRKAYDLSFQSSFRNLQRRLSSGLVSGCDDSVLRDFYTGKAKWLYLSKKASRGRPIKLNVDEVRLLDKFIENMLEAGIIRKTKRLGFISFPVL